ncbi:MAG TPA: fused MFS/spermidine synthase [Candidatus Acidoferrum sp.]|nr:fused MFS/spermidine synthase [Candidatus Acidoferrum sp.]
MRNPQANLLSAATIFLSALLLFQVEPLIGKIILPWFGGVAAVWTVCLLFFQVVLLLGYLYAHLLTRRFRQRTQGWIHIAVLATSLLVLPILPRDSWKPAGPEHPALHILEVLVLAVGLPFFVLTATSPLLQAWLASARKDTGVYRFYALSNAGSLLGLLTYPVLIEPRLSILRQGWGWSFAYAVFAVACGMIAITQRDGARTPTQEAIAPLPRWNTRALWIALPACSSALLLAVTNHITQNIAAVPFLWIIPLSLYMLSFMLCFGSRRYHRMFFLRLLGVALGCMAYALSPSLTSLPLWILISVFCTGLFLCCMFCHGELATLKPDPSHLTSFYFWSSLGSVVGAAFVALLAPQIFSGFYELHVSLGACVLLAVLVHRRDPASPFRQPHWRLALCVLYGLAITIIVALFLLARDESASSNRMARNFYGVLRVSDESAPNVVLLKGDQQAAPKDDLRFRRLMNGTITHGLQFLGAARRDQPASYYGPDSGIGVAFTAFASRSPRRVGVIGLGTGTIAAYGHNGDQFTFYEINPLVVRIARQEFTFLRDSKARISFELGDARLTLERQPPQNLDLLAVDAFSSDSIPVHLLTLEAFELYFRHLKPDGVLAVHISNRHLYLEPVVAAAAEKLGKDAVLIESPSDRENEIFLARWVLLANAGVLQQFPDIEEAGEPATSLARVKLWTDSYSSLFAVLK